MLTAVMVIMSTIVTAMVTSIIWHKVLKKKIRFSLLTLLLVSVNLACGVVVYQNWNPWQQESFSLPECNVDEIAVSPDGKTMACVCRPSRMQLGPVKIVLVDSASKEVIKELSYKPSNMRVRFTPDSQNLILSDYYNIERLSIADGNIQSIYHAPLTGGVILDVTSDGKKALTAKDYGSGHNSAHLGLLSIDSGTSVSWSEHSFNMVTPGGTLSSDGTRFAGIDGSDVLIYDMIAEKELLRIPNMAHPFGLKPEFSADGTRLLVIGRSDSFKTSFVGINSYSMDGKKLSQIPACTIHAVLSPDGKHALILTFGTNGSAGNVELWHLRRPEQSFDPIHFPEFTLALLFGAASIFSLLRDFRTLNRRSDAGPPIGDNSGTRSVFCAV